MCLKKVCNVPYSDVQLSITDLQSYHDLLWLGMTEHDQIKAYRSAESKHTEIEVELNGVHDELSILRFKIDRRDEKQEEINFKLSDAEEALEESKRELKDVVERYK